jgi:ribosomal subunit interface protein
MQVRISGKQIAIGGALPQRARSRMEAAIGKYFDGGVDASVVFSHEGTFYRADCTVHLDSGVVLKAGGDGNDAYRAFDTALDRVEKRVRRYLRRLKNHHEKTKAPKALS